MNLLDQIVADSRHAMQGREKLRSLGDLKKVCQDIPARRPFTETLAAPGISLIAEHKRCSPSAGAIRPESDLRAIIHAYESGGAAAVSILTEETHFDGSLDDLEVARSISDLPLLRKDFIIDAYQLFESAVAGADAVLLIAAVLDDNQLHDLYRQARDDLDLDVLVEVHTEDELERSLTAVDADLIGINNRDLHDFHVDTERTFELLSAVPAGKVVVAESGFSKREELEELERVGVDAVLVGEALMREDDVRLACSELTGHTF